jgi:DNA polymerase
MAKISRAARQLLRDLQSAGLTHLPRAIPRPVATSKLAPAPKRPASAPDHEFKEEMAKKPAPVLNVPAPVFTLPSGKLSNAERIRLLGEVAKCVSQCVRCPHLASARTQTVFGAGNPRARVMFIGEAPGADEDRTGEPFVGRAGQLLSKIIEACGWTREEIYICNILRCRPPDNRTPTEQEATNCREFLDAQIALVKPEYIVCWGSCAAQNLLGTKDPIGRMREKFYQHGAAKVLCTYHPSYLLRNPAAKKPVWEDMKLLLKDMGLAPPSLSQ